MKEDCTWQERLVWSALEAGKVTEEQALLLAALYREANYRTRVLSDFRAERACEWLGHDLAYVRTMQQRLQALRKAGWFTSTYRQGVKTPYDIKMRSFGDVSAPPCGVHGVNDTVSVSKSDGFLDRAVDSPLREVSEILQASPQHGDAHTSQINPQIKYVAELRTRIYQQTGEMLDRLLTPSQIDSLLDRHEVCAVAYAVKTRMDKIRDKRQFHRSFASFLRDGGVQIELDAVHLELKEDLEIFHLAAGGTSANTIDPIKDWLEMNLDAFEVFPDIGYDAASLVYAFPVTQEVTQ
jgi:hypothetical protein